MKVSFRIATIGLALGLSLPPVAALAQSQMPEQPLTHAQLIDQLVQLRNDGYVPSKIHYPADIQAAHAHADVQSGAGASSNSGIGGAVAGASQAGSPMRTNAGTRSMYARH